MNELKKKTISQRVFLTFELKANALRFGVECNGTRHEVFVDECYILFRAASLEQSTGPVAERLQAKQIEFARVSNPDTQTERNTWIVIVSPSDKDPIAFLQAVFELKNARIFKRIAPSAKS